MALPRKLAVANPPQAPCQPPPSRSNMRGRRRRSGYPGARGRAPARGLVAARCPGPGPRPHPPPARSKGRACFGPTGCAGSRRPGPAGRKLREHPENVLADTIAGESHPARAAQADVYAHVKAHARPAGVPVTVSGEAFLSGGMHDWLRAWSVEHQPVLSRPSSRVRRSRSVHVSARTA